MFFKTKAEANAERIRQLTALERHGREAIALPQHELSDFIRARRKLAEYGETINDALKFRVDHLERVRRCRVTVSQLADEVLQAKRKDGHSEAYLSDLKLRLGIFCRDFGNRLIASITVEEIDKWLRGLDCSPKSRSNYRANIGVMFSYAERLGMIERNPVLRTAKPKLVDKAPEIFTVDELRALLEAAHRIVPIQLNLAGWLRPYRGMKGPLVPVGARDKLDRVRKEAGLARWPKNGLRHSFASYRLAAIGDAPRVAHELGHTSPQMLYSTYREVVTPEEAERYWKIAPAAEAKNLVPFATA